MLKTPTRLSEWIFLSFFVLASLMLADRLLITNAPEHYPDFLLTQLNVEKADMIATRELCGEPLEIIVRRDDFLVRCGFAFPRHTWVVDKKYLNKFTGLEG